MASDISNGPTRANSIWVAPRGVTTGRTRARVGSRLAFALCLLLAAALGGAVVSACGSSSTESVSPAPVVSGSPVALATPAAVQEFRSMLPYVSTSSLVRERSYASTKTVGDVVQGRHAVWTFRCACSDPRLAGTEEVVINGDQRQSDMSATMWGTSRLRNAGGTWVKRWTGGIAAGGDAHHFYGTLKGTGGYAGLVAHGSAWVAESGEGFTSDLQIIEAAWIETTDGSPVPPAPGPVTTPADWTPVAGIATLRDDYDWTFDLTMSDPRVSGEHVGSPEEIGSQRADGSIDYLAESTLTNQDGAWDSPSGIVNVRGPGPGFEHFMYWTSTGSGAYAGLTYHGFWRFMERQPLAVDDTFVWTGWIEETK